MTLTPTERATIHTLISLARLTYLALDDSEEFVDDDGRCYRISGQAFDDVEATLETLDELPDDKPGVALSSAGRAEWALRRLLATDAVIQEPVAWMHDGPGRFDVIHSAVKKLLRDSHDVVGHLSSRPLDRSGRYTIPLYAELPVREAPAVDTVPVMRDDANNYCLILRLLGMEEEGDPVAEVARLQSESAKRLRHG